MIFRALLPVLFLTLICQSIFANQMKAPTTPKNPNVSAGINANLKNLYKAKKQLELSQTLTSKLHQIRNTQNESFSRILQQAYQLERGKMPSKAKIQQLDTFLRQAIKFRDADKQLSTKTVTRLVRANKSFDGLKRTLRVYKDSPQKLKIGIKHVSKLLKSTIRLMVYEQNWAMHHWNHTK